MHEGEGLVVTVETRCGAVYRGTVESVEDSMNVGLRGVAVTTPDGKTAALERVFIRGSTVLLVIFPDVLKMAPMFERLRKAAAGLSTAGGLGRGRQMAIEAKGAAAANGGGGAHRRLQARADARMSLAVFLRIERARASLSPPPPPLSHALSQRPRRRAWQQLGVVRAHPPAPVHRRALRA